MQRLKLLTQAMAPYFKKDGLRINYKKGQLFVRPEDSSQGLYYLDSGQALLYTTKSGGVEQIVGIWEEGAVFGKVGSVMSQPFTTVSTQALTDCVVYRLSCDQFQNLLNKKRPVLEAYMKQVSFNNIYILNLVLNLGERNIYLRVISELLLLAEYYGDCHDRGYTLRIILTQEQFANMLCITREYLSKTLKKVKDKKLVVINKKGRIRIPNLTALQQEMEAS